MPAKKLSLAAVKPRDLGLESLRGFLILCVLIGHLPTSLIFAGRETGWAAALWDWKVLVYLFHVPAFLALSCLFVPARDWRWMGKRALLLMLPYLFWLARPTFFDPIGDLHRFYEAQKSLTQANWAWDHSVLWFLPALLACNAVVAVLGRLPKAWAWGLALAGFAMLRWQIDAVAALHVAGRVPYSLDVAVYFAPLFLAAREAYARRQLFAKVPVWVWALFFVLGTALLQVFEPLKLHSEYHLRVDLAQFSVPESLLGLLGITAAVLSLVLAFAGRQGAAWLAWLAWLGQRSMPLYLMHYYFLSVGWDKFKVHPAWVQSEAALACVPLALLLAGLAGPSLISWAARRLSPYARYFGMEA